MAWQAVQAFFLASSSLARAGAARTARPVARRMAGVFFMVGMLPGWMARIYEDAIVGIFSVSRNAASLVMGGRQVTPSHTSALTLEALFCDSTIVVGR